MSYPSAHSLVRCTGIAMLGGVLLLAACGPTPETISASVNFRQVAKGFKCELDASLTLDGTPVFREIPGGKVEARVTLSGLKEGMFESCHLAWIRPDGKEIFRKLVEFSAEENTYSIKSSFTVSPERERMPGGYKLMVYRHRRLVTSGEFELKSMPEITADLRFVSTGTTEAAVADSIPLFAVAEGAKVRIEVTVRGCEPGFSEELQIRWVDPHGKTVFEKDASFTPEGAIHSIRGSMSINPKRNRALGLYGIEIYRGAEQLTRGSFNLMGD